MRTCTEHISLYLSPCALTDGTDTFADCSSEFEHRQVEARSSTLIRKQLHCLPWSGKPAAVQLLPGWTFQPRSRSTKPEQQTVAQSAEPEVMATATRSTKCSNTSMLARRRFYAALTTPRTSPPPLACAKTGCGGSLRGSGSRPCNLGSCTWPGPRMSLRHDAPVAHDGQKCARVWLFRVRVSTHCWVVQIAMCMEGPE